LTLKLTRLSFDKY